MTKLSEDFSAVDWHHKRCLEKMYFYKDIQEHQQALLTLKCRIAESNRVGNPSNMLLIYLYLDEYWLGCESTDTG